MAILLVYMVHYNYFGAYKFDVCIAGTQKINPLRNGDLGVDIFFVLSGFLIADILIREIRKHGHIDYFHFLRSRFLRIWPALFVEAIVGLAFGQEVKAGIFSLLFIFNFFFYETGDICGR
jgi:peptidoglycan/LPS O-acetylase OafA/YrhL